MLFLLGLVTRAWDVLTRVCVCNVCVTPTSLQRCYRFVLSVNNPVRLSSALHVCSSSLFLLFCTFCPQTLNTWKSVSLLLQNAFQKSRVCLIHNLPNPLTCIFTTTTTAAGVCVGVCVCWPRGQSLKHRLTQSLKCPTNRTITGPVLQWTASDGSSVCHGVKEMRFRGDTLLAGVLLESGANRSVDGVSIWSRTCEICLNKAFPSSRACKHRERNVV